MLPSPSLASPLPSTLWALIRLRLLRSTGIDADIGRAAALEKRVQPQARQQPRTVGTGVESHAVGGADVQPAVFDGGGDQVSAGVVGVGVTVVEGVGHVFQTVHGGVEVVAGPPGTWGLVKSREPDNRLSPVFAS